MLRSMVDSSVSDILSQSGGVADADTFREVLAKFQGIFFPRGALAEGEGLTTRQLADRVYQLAVNTYEAKEAANSPAMMRELERAVMLRVVDEYWMDNIDAMDDLKQGIGLRAYGQHDPVIAYKEEGFQMFEAMITAIREETVRRLFVMQLVTEEALKRRQVAKELSATGSGDGSLKKKPVRKSDAQRIGPNDPCHCGSGKKYKKCCMQKDKTAE